MSGVDQILCTPSSRRIRAVGYESCGLDLGPAFIKSGPSILDPMGAVYYRFGHVSFDLGARSLIGWPTMPGTPFSRHVLQKRPCHFSESTRRPRQ
jgi:hypothetical protein